MQDKVTIIGGSGFVGTSLCRKLSTTSIEFEILDINTSDEFPDKCKIADVRDIESLTNNITGNIIINLAAVHRDDVADFGEYWRTNVDGAKNVTSVCNELGINKIIFTSTVAVYGFAKANTDEDGIINPFNDYGKTKFQAEEIYKAWHKNKNNSLIIVRPTVIFGNGNKGNVFNLFNQINSGKFIMVGDGKNIKSLAYIENVSAFLEACIVTKLNFGIFNYIDGPDITMNELVSLARFKLRGKKGVGVRMPRWLGMLLGYIFDFLSKITGVTFSISSIRIKKFLSTTQFASSKIELDGFKAPFELKFALEETLCRQFNLSETSQKKHCNH